MSTFRLSKTLSTENVDLLALYGTDYIVRLGLEGSCLYLRKIVPRFQTSQGNTSTPAWTLITSTTWIDDFYPGDSILFKHVYSQFKLFAKSNGLTPDPLTFIAWYHLYGDDCVTEIMLNDLNVN